MHRTADSVGNVQRISVGSEAGIGTIQLDNEALGRLAFKSQSAKRVEVGDRYGLGHVMHDVGVVPDALGRERATANSHPVDTIVHQPVAADQGTLVAKFSGE